MPPDAPKPAPRSLLVRAADRGPEESMRHPLNPDSELHGWTLSRKVGLARTGVNFIRIPPGKESFVLHLHHVEEEWMYVLSGKGIATVGDEALEIGPGDFLGFPPRTHAHNVRNPGPEDLTYLAGGENVAVEVGDFPALGKRLLRIGAEATLYPLAGEPFWPGG
jgi:uncharacterized cupin superfamily protein